MSSWIIYTYQHTCKNGYPAYILQNAPFKAVKKNAGNGKVYIPFLGEGYYFWEENREYAIKWGQRHYANKYDIVEFEDVKIINDDLLNLTDRRHISYFKELQKIYLAKRPESSKWRLGTWIEFFKKLRDLKEEKFPFNYIKADEHLPDIDENILVREKVYFATGVNHYSFFSPLLIICVLDKSKITCKSKYIL